VDRDHGVPGVILAREERVLLHPVQLTLESGEGLLHLIELAVVRGELEELREVIGIARERVVALPPPCQARVLGRDRGRALLIVPEARLPHRLLELGDAGAQRVRVKGNHGPSRAGP
jgi:hypothetical protein